MREESALGVARFRIRRVVSMETVRARLLRAAICLVSVVNGSTGGGNVRVGSVGCCFPV